ncbi:MAG: hypothetical protein SCALA702_19110 [Melioribacteraceae bacterium]|nr:MAG: hypothetical protein SCALA702_19110 [Melioribacteraceae bacterium]
MTERLVLFRVIIFFLVASGLFAQDFGNRRAESLLFTAFDSVKNGEYDTAYSYFDTLDIEFPELSIGKIYKAGIIILKDYDYVLGYDPDSLYQLLDEAVELAEENYDNDPDDLLNVYQYAIALGLKGYYDALQKNYFSALTESIYSLQYFHECLEIDPEAYDAYVAIGSYKFWVSEVGKDVLYLPFIEDEREPGMHFLKLAIEKNTYHSYAAIHSLAFAYFYSKKFEKGIELLEDVLRKHPGNRIFAQLLADTYFNYDKEKAIILYNKLLERYRNSVIKSNVREVEILHKLAQIYEKLQKNELALNCCNNILEYKLNGFEKSYLSGRLERVHNLRDKLISVEKK